MTTQEARYTIARGIVTDAQSQANRLNITIGVYMALGIIGSLALFGSELPGLGFVGLLTTALTAGCAGALVHVVRLLAVIASRDLPPVEHVQRAEGPISGVLSRQGALMLVAIVVVGVLLALVVAALVS